jgi:phosphatidylglycerol:prolipoprotein diacylglycerol transferase
MRPEIFHIPGLGLPIHSYGLLIVLGFLLAIYLASREARRRGLPDFVYDLGFVMLLGGLVGARLLYYVLNYSDPVENRFLHSSRSGKGGWSFLEGPLADSSAE